MSKPKDIRRVIKELNPAAIFINGFDEALYGTGRAIGGQTVAIYIADDCLRMLIEDHDMEEEEAWEHFNKIVTEGQSDPNKPIFISDWRKAINIDDALDQIKLEKQATLDDILKSMEEDLPDDDDDDDDTSLHDDFDYE